MQQRYSFNDSSKIKMIFLENFTIKISSIIPCRHRLKIGEKPRFYQQSLLFFGERHLIIYSVNSANFSNFWC